MVVSDNDKADIFERLRLLEVGVAKIGKDIEHIVDKLPEQPCRYHKELEDKIRRMEEEASQARRDWRQTGMRVFERLLTYAIIALAAYAKGKGMF